MDPNACLLHLRAMANAVINDGAVPEDAMLEMAEMVTNLDQWIVNGGFLPERWIAS